MTIIYEDEDLAAEVVKAIQTGQADTLDKLLAEHPHLVHARIVRRDYVENSNELGMSRTLLHIIVTDWPGNFPNGAKTVKVLIEAGADVNARFMGPHNETALHWAASSNDVEVMDALLDGGAEIDADGAVIGGGTPLDDAVAFAQWNAATRLVERGAQTKLWNEAALGLMNRIQQRFQGGDSPAPEQITEAFWLACHGGQKRSAEYLFAQEADLNWIGYDNLTPLEAVQRNHAHHSLIEWLINQGAKGANEGW
ncbi:ankyrin repeat domain-containing protein [Jeotgalibacillus sp. ET6]|uniref:ankyrin repeat domain-containing protein n=1 Tax=Jeotgalibacillus sp. ET6 TaxID=3037260 RepID=UPI0024189E5B|nr:ankyrin repeat domain-containing protein [Jeotgalibacillus sp. ET6]MDG5473152.1 ankyrin repeat domain-containing protein [Jeotgalibacillus sp. ET6]